MLQSLGDQTVAGAKFTPVPSERFIHGDNELTVQQTFELVKDIVTLKESVEESGLLKKWRWALPSLRELMARLKSVADEGIL